MAHKEFCSHCPEPYTWNQESLANVGCLVAMVVPLAVMILLWVFLFSAFIFR